MTTDTPRTDTPRTDTPRTNACHELWKLTPFASALLEHDGETCNEIFCADADEAECLVDLLNSQERTIKKLASRIDRINNDNFNLANTLSKAEADVERLKAINADMRNFLARAIHNEGFNEEKALKFIYQ